VNCDADHTLHTTVFTQGPAQIGSDASFDFSGSGSDSEVRIPAVLKGTSSNPTTAARAAQVDVAFDPAVDGVTACHSGALTWTAKSNQ
jgi:hypothetical protein